MQRAPFVPANSPPLHHPVPQHVSTVPQLRSPPPPAQQQTGPQMNSYGNPYQPNSGQGGMGSFNPGFGGFINDPTAQVGFQVAQSGIKAGQEYMEQNLNRYVSIPALKHYFNVSNSYVLRKILLVLFPWRHKPWNRQQARVTTSSGADGQMQQQYTSMYLPPRDDINSPDMYIPIMAFITYILLSTVLAGLRGKFQPELLGSITTSALAVVLFEIMILKVAMYILNINNDSQLLDLVAYSGYKFVGVIITLAVAEILSGGNGTGGAVGWTVFIYTFLANALFLLRSLKYVLLPDSSNDVSMRSGASYTQGRAQRNRRTQFLFVYAYVIQLFFMWILSREEAAMKTVASKVRSSS